MHNYLITATGPDGKRDTQLVQAENSQAAYRKLLTQGYDDIVLHTDDFSAVLSPLTEVEVGGVTPRALAENFSVKKPSRSSQFRSHATKVALWFIPTAVLVISSGHLLLGTASGLGIVLASKTTYFVIKKLLSNSEDVEVLRRRLFESESWARWEDVLVCVKQLRGSISNIILDTCETKALARLDRVDEGIELISDSALANQTPPWFFFFQRAQIYHSAGLVDDAIENLSKSFEEAPSNPTVVMTYADALLQMEQKTPFAAQLVHQLHCSHLTEVSAIFLSFVDGLLMLNLGDTPSATKELEKFVADCETLAAMNPAAAKAQDFGRAYLALALFDIGEHERAAQEANRAIPRIMAFEEERLLERLAPVIA